tara:strand:- start:903 stop:1109 length:207 start_codon:yes stop_codon:yes gene_type:complete
MDIKQIKTKIPNMNDKQLKQAKIDLLDHMKKDNSLKDYAHVIDELNMNSFKKLLTIFFSNKFQKKNEI